MSTEITHSIALVVFSWAIAIQAPALACFSVAKLDVTREQLVAAELNQAEVVFVGKPVRVSRVERPLWLWPWPQDFGVLKVEFEVSQTWKGQTTQSSMSIHGFDDSCNRFSDYVWERVDGEWREVEDYIFSEAEQQDMVVLADYPLPALGKTYTTLIADQAPPSVDEITQHLGTGHPVEAVTMLSAPNNIWRDRRGNGNTAE